MEKEDKELLLKDLCARLHFGVHVNYKNVEDKEGIIMLNPYNIQHVYSGWWKKYKPYLRPMSSMTEEEKVEYCDLQDKFLLSSQYPVTCGYALFDWLNAHHFDYRRLIEKGLAIEAPEGMYK